MPSRFDPGSVVRPNELGSALDPNSVVRPGELANQRLDPASVVREREFEKKRRFEALKRLLQILGG